MATSASTYATSPFQPMARAGLTSQPQQQFRQQSGPDSAGLTKAMSMVVLSCSRGYDQAMSQDAPALSQQNPSQLQPSSQAPHSFQNYSLQRRLALELSQAQSQELPQCTPDFATPGEPQQFMVDYDPNGVLGLEDEGSRSPAPSPRRIKRQRPILADAESDSQMSQPSQSQSRSQGEPSTCSKAASGIGGQGKPPMHPHHHHHGRGSLRRRQHEPPVVRNPYLNPANDDKHIYHANTSQSMSMSQNRLLWDFKQEDKLGGGHFSEVFSVVHRMSGKRYALKKSKRPVVTIGDKNMWLGEVQAMAAVEGHPNIVTFYDSWVEPADNQPGEWFFIRMELCGPSLGPAPQQAANGAMGGSSAGLGLSGNSQGMIGAGGLVKSVKGGGAVRTGPRQPMKEVDLLEVLRQMASALKHIHDLGLAHLDLKPDNIYVSPPPPPAPPGLQGAPSVTQALTNITLPNATQSGTHPGSSSPSAPSTPVTYKLGDFGLATSKTALAPLMEGDARYLAPEMLSRRSEWGLDRADLFALGATLYELATGSPLPTGGERYHALRQGQLMMMPCVSIKMQQLIKKLMSADPKDRPTADQILRSPLLNKNNTSSGGGGGGHGGAGGSQMILSQQQQQSSSQPSSQT